MSDEPGLSAISKQKIASEKLELIEYVDKRINDNSARDRDLIKYTITTVLSIVGTSLTVMTLVLAIVGLQTFSDVRKRVNDLTSSIVHDEISRYNVEQKYKSGMDRIYAKQIIATAKNSKGSIVSDDKIFLMNYILSNGMDNSIFTEGLSTLSVFHGDGNIGKTLDARVLEYINDQSKKSQLTEDENSKLSAVINYFADTFSRVPVTTIRNMSSDRARDLNVRTAAINYLGAVNDVDSVEVLTNLLTEEDPIKIAALEAIANLAPDSPLLYNWVESIPFFHRFANLSWYCLKTIG